MKQPRLFDRVKIIPKTIMAEANLKYRSAFADVIQLSENKFCSLTDDGKSLWIDNDDIDYSWVNITHDRSSTL